MRLDYSVLLYCGCLSIPSVLHAQQEEKQAPNIVFILSDDHACSAVSAYEGIYSSVAPTPNIDKIAENGAILRNMMCTNSISGPSRACLLTGKYSTTHGFYQNEGGIVFDNTQQQYQKILKDNGYTTGLFGKWHLFSEPQGFDYYMIHNNPGQQGSYWNPIYSINGKNEKKKGYAVHLTTNAALSWLDEVRESGKPFCLMLHYKAPHRPWEPDSCYMDLFANVEFPYPKTFDDTYNKREKTLGRSMATMANHLSRGDLKQIPPEGLTPKERNKWLWWGGSGEEQYWSPNASLEGEELKKWKYQTFVKDYFRVIKSVDDEVGRVIRYLKDKGLYENTIVIYMGDNGFFLGEHGIYDKRWMYEEGLHMPCLISFPKQIRKGGSIDEITLNIDIAPTILDFAGIQIPQEMQGESMKRLLIGEENICKNWRKSMYYQYFEYPKWHNVQPHYGIRTERYKLIHFYYDVDEWELYDLQNDPFELHNIYKDKKYDDITYNLKKELQQLQKQYGDTLSLPQRRKLTEKYMVRYDK